MSLPLGIGSTNFSASTPPQNILSPGLTALQGFISSSDLQNILSAVFTQLTNFSPNVGSWSVTLKEKQFTVTIGKNPSQITLTIVSAIL